MDIGKTTISSSVLIPLMSFAAEKGFSIRMICDEAGVDSDLFSDANSRITLESTDRLLETISDLTQEPLLAIKVGYRLGTRSCNLLQHLMIVCPNLQESIRKHQDFNVLFTDEPAPILVENDEEGIPLASLKYPILKSQHERGSALRTLISISAQKYWLSFKCGKDFKPYRICLDIPEPTIGGAIIRQYLGAEVRFNQPENAIHFERRFLHIQSPYYNQHLIDLMEKESLALKMMLDSRGPRVANKIRKALREGHLSYRLSIEQAADYIGVSARTLNRYLSSEGTNFKNLLNEERIALAHRLLSEGKNCLEDIAQEVGYSSRRSFDRAFTLTVGYSPAQARNRITI